jgi:N-acetylmuramoyl-L-alanine amidase
LSNVSMSNPVPYVIIHHSEGTPCSTTSDCLRVVRGIQDFHMDLNGWDDIGYSFTIGENGLVYEARGWSRVGAHAPNYNANSIGF